MVLTTSIPTKTPMIYVYIHTQTNMICIRNPKYTHQTRDINPVSYTRCRYIGPLGIDIWAGGLRFPQIAVP